MKTVALIPYWSGYSFPEDSISRRDVVLLGGQPLINYAIKTANKVAEIDEVVIYASDKDILDAVDEQLSCTFVQRDSDLDSQDVSIEDIIERFLAVSDADLIVLLHPKNPFLKPTTVSSCIKKVQDDEYDSSFVVTKARKFAWFNEQPLNYSLENDTPSLSQITPVFLESSSVYVFSRDTFARKRSRIGERPYLQEVGHFEGFEVDRADDYEIAELIVNAGFELTGV
jgi:CMP-N-acetylneuraminic acid synthetase